MPSERLSDVLDTWMPLLREPMLENELTKTDSARHEHQQLDEGSGARNCGIGWLIAFFLILITTLLVFLFSPAIVRANQWPDINRIIYLSSLVPICCFVGAFAGLGIHPWRWPVVLLLGPLIGWYASFSIGGGDLAQFEAFCLGIIGTVASTTVGLRLWKGTLRRVGPGSRHADGLQFGIKDLLIWTTVAAILITVGQALFKFGGKNYNSTVNEFLMIFGLSVSLAIATLINIWALFGNQISAFKLLMLVLMTFGSAASCSWFFPGPQLFFAVIAVVNQFVVISMIFTLRKYGYRFVKGSE